jgi:hypothetical protein
MGIFDKFLGNKSGQTSGSSNTCPLCGSMAMSIMGRVICTNPTCKNFAVTALSSQGSSAPNQSSQPGSTSSHSGSFSPQRPITIRYQNFRGEQKSFTSDAATVVPNKNFLSVQVAPSGERITLARKRILNLSEFESAIPQTVASGKPWPSPKERQVLNYHKKHGSTSPLYEKIRAKYPNW